MIVGLMWALAAGAAPFDTLAQDDGWRDLNARASAWGPIAVRSRVVDGTTCYEGSLSAAVDVDALVRTADAMRDASRWSRAKLPVSEELDRRGREFVLLQVLDTPGWTLAADRYWVLRAVTGIDAQGRGSYRYERVPAAAWPRAVEVAAAHGSALVEPPVSFGEWTFTPSGSGTRVVYRSCADFGGVVPAGLQSWVALQQLPDTMEDLVSAASRR